MNTETSWAGILRALAHWSRRALALALALWLVMPAVPAPASAPGADFDHLRTGFALSGAHGNLRCESCHAGGAFKGTPRDCESCHVSGAKLARGNVVRPVQHIPTTQACESCHNTRAFSGAKMNHAGVVKGGCTTCHNGAAASGKPGSHPRTAASCDSCHGAIAWRPVLTFDHSGVAPGNCASCHDGGRATGRGASHTPYQLVAALSGATCDTCHRSGFASWTPTRLHASVAVSTQCSACHTAAKPANAVHAGQTVCESCHKSTSTWTGARVDHGTFTAATDCASCHNGSAASGKSATHIPVAATNCFTCHGTANWKPTKWTHNQLPVTNQCASCHTGGYPPADGKGATHTPYHLVAAISSANCDSCHKAGYSAWTPAKLHTSVSVAAQCATCHAGIKPATAVHAGQTVCESCHKSTSTWTGARVDHGTFTAATDCASCHNGSAASGKTASHIPVGATGCYTCHGTTTWRPSKWNHTQLPVVAQCASCHTGSYPPADGKGATHTPYQLVATISSANCDSCHKAGYSAWTPAKLHSSVVVTTQCSTCHAGIKPATAVHAGQTVCESCHKSTSTWTGARVDHSTFTAATDCTRCHNGAAASGKPATHVPVGATNCYACHGTATWRPSKWNHTQAPVTAQCASCHTGSYPPADGKPASHTPYQLVAAGAAANCDTCHRSGYASWIGAKVHANLVISTQCATCHAGIKPATAIHAGQTVCESCHKSTSTWTGARVDHGTYTAATNCASCHNGSAASGKSATHIPVGATNCYTCHGTTTWRPSKWNHTQVPVTAQCAGCHTGGYPPADGKPASHTPYQLVAAGAAANCDTCHRSGYVSWTGAKVHSNLTIVSQCSTCHLAIRPSTQVHVGQTQCESCHRSTSTWTGARIDHGTFTAATDCTRCHNGSTATGKPLTHIPVGATNCYVCHNATLWRPTKWNHTQVVVTAQCASCHTGSYPPADGKPASHLPYQLVSTLAGVNCDACHKGSYATWANGRVHANATVTGQCKTCHGGSYTAAGATGKPANHIPEVQLLNGAAMECSACHTSTSSWGSMRMNHNNSLGGGAGWCKACHLRGTTYAGSMERHTMTHKSKTPPAVDCSESGCHRPLGSKGATFSKWD